MPVFSRRSFLCKCLLMSNVDTDQFHKIKYLKLFLD